MSGTKLCAGWMLAVVFLGAVTPKALAATIMLTGDELGTGNHAASDLYYYGLRVGTYTGEINNRWIDPVFSSAGAQGKVFDVDGSGSARIAFDSDVSRVRFLYGGRTGEIHIQARDISGAVVDSVVLSTSPGPTGQETLQGPGIRSLTWQDPAGDFAALDNLYITGGFRRAPGMFTLVAFFDESVDEGTLAGRGSGGLADLRLRLMRSLFVYANAALENERPLEVFLWLLVAYWSCDGADWPVPDLVSGEAAPDLANLIRVYLLAMLENP